MLETAGCSPRFDLTAGDRRGAGRPAHRRHRRHRLPGHRAGRAPPALCPRLRGDAAGAARAAGRGRPGPAGDPAQRLLRPSPRGAGRRLRGGDQPPRPARGRRRVASTASASTTTGGRAGRGATSSSTRPPPVSFDSPSTPPSRSTSSGRRASPGDAADGSAAHLVAVSTAYVAGNRRGDAPEALLPDTPFATDVDWRAEVAAARRARADADAESRRPDELASFATPGPPRARRGRHAAAGRPGRDACASSGSTTGWSSSAGPGPGPWAGPTPTPTPRPSANGPCSRTAATSPSPSCARRSSSRPWPSPTRAGSAASAWPSR